MKAIISAIVVALIVVVSTTISFGEQENGVPPPAYVINAISELEQNTQQASISGYFLRSRLLYRLGKAKRLVSKGEQLLAKA